MKNYILLTCLTLVSSLVFSQTKLNLKINHKMGANAFAFNTQTTNNLGNPFDFSRMEYYLTVVSVTHDGGTVTPINRVFLINAGHNGIDSLASLAITNLEKVTVAVGVHVSLNHLDPSLYPMAHPLAPKSPSMHWGWTPGYRFVAMEGTTFAINPRRVYELHSLGNVSYFYSTINTAGVTANGEKTIELNADYLEAIRDIDVSNGPLIHGEAVINKKHLENFRDHVFTSIEGNPSVGIETEIREKIEFTVSPNPATESQNVTVKFTKEYKDISIVIMDITGKIVVERAVKSNILLLDNLSQGMYICTVRNKEKLALGSQKFIITK